MRLKDSKQKFSGALGQCWKNVLNEYKHIAEDHRLYKHQKLSYLYNMLSKDEHCCYLERVKTHVTSYSDAVKTVEKE